MLSLKDTAGRLSDPSLHQRHKALEMLREKAPGTLIGLLLQCFDDLRGLSTACLGYGDELLVGVFGFLSLTPGDPVQPLSRAPHTPVAPAEEILAQSTNLLGGQYLLRSPEQAREHPYPVAQKSAVGGMVNVGLHHRAIHPELAPAGDLQ